MKDFTYFLIGMFCSGISLIGYMVATIYNHNSWILLIFISISFVCGAYLLVTNYKSLGIIEST